MDLPNTSSMEKSVEMTEEIADGQLVKTTWKKFLNPSWANQSQNDIVDLTKGGRSERYTTPAMRMKRLKEQKHEIDQFEDAVDTDDTTWEEVVTTCFVHTPLEWLQIFVSMIMFLGCLYLFGLGLDFLSSGAKVMAGCAAGELFGSSVNPVAGVMVGILATVLLQSSSTTTSIIVGLVGADDSVFTVDQGIYMIMGANIGTTVTNTIVSLLQFQNQKQMAEAFTGATVHDIFNFFTVSILLPLEVLTGYLRVLTEALVQGANTEKGDKWEGPAKKVISPLGKRILIANKGVTNAVAAGGSCRDFYPISCEDPENPTYDTCDTGLIACDKTHNFCPAFFDARAGVREDQSAGLVVLCMGLFVIFVSLVLLVQVMTRLLRGVSIRIIHKATELNGYVLIFIGTGIAAFLQSSSTTTSFLTPLVGIGALRVEQMYPLTIGANIGTTVSALLSALVTDGNEALQVALAHLMFNITGMLIWYPIEYLRSVPVTCARRLGQYARVWRPFALIYLLSVFFLLPMIGLGLSTLFLNDTEVSTIVGSLLTALLGVILVVWIRWFYFCGGRAKFYRNLSKKHERYVTLLTLTTDMEAIRRHIEFHEEYAGVEAPPAAHRQSIMTSPESSGESSSINIRLEEESAPMNYTINSLLDGSHRSAASSQQNDGGPRKSRRASIMYDSSVRDALSTVADDMAYLKAGLAILNFHTGMRDDDEEDEEDSETGSELGSSSGEDMAGAPPMPAPSAPSIADMIHTMEKREVSYITLWAIIPNAYIYTALLATGAMVWGIVALFRHGGKASIGAAYFLVCVSVIAITWAFVSLDAVALHDYFVNRNRAKRRETIDALPTDMKVLKRKVRRLLRHYKLDVEDLLGYTNWDTTQTHEDLAG